MKEKEQRPKMDDLFVESPNNLNVLPEATPVVIVREDTFNNILNTQQKLAEAINKQVKVPKKHQELDALNLNMVLDDILKTSTEQIRLIHKHRLIQGILDIYNNFKGKTYSEYVAEIKKENEMLKKHYESENEKNHLNGNYSYYYAPDVYIYDRETYDFIIETRKYDDKMNEIYKRNKNDD